MFLLREHVEQQRLQVGRREPLGERVGQPGHADLALDALDDPVAHRAQSTLSGKGAAFTGKSAASGLARRSGSAAAPHARGFGVRVETGNFKEDALPAGFDVALLANLLSVSSEETNRALLARIHAALPPGGAVLLSGWILDDARTSPLVPVLFCLEDINWLAPDVERSAATYTRWLEEAGFKNLGNLADHDDIFAATTYLMKRTTIAANPRLPEQIIRAQAEAIKRFYDDKAFAVKAYQAYDKQATADVERLYDGYSKANVLERVPYVLSPALQAVIDQQSDAKLLALGLDVTKGGRDEHADRTRIHWPVLSRSRRTTASTPPWRSACTRRSMRGWLPWCRSTGCCSGGRDTRSCRRAG